MTTATIDAETRAKDAIILHDNVKYLSIPSLSSSNTTASNQKWLIAASTGLIAENLRTALLVDNPSITIEAESYLQTNANGDDEHKKDIELTQLLDLAILVVSVGDNVGDLEFKSFVQTLSTLCLMSKRVVVLSLSAHPTLDLLVGSVLSAQWEFPNHELHCISFHYSVSICFEDVSRVICLELSCTGDSLPFVHYRCVDKCFVRWIEQCTQSQEIDQAAETFGPNDVIVITGGLGGLGLETAKGLLQCGVKKIMLWSRSGNVVPEEKPYYDELLQIAKQNGDAIISKICCDVDSLDAVKNGFIATLGSFGDEPTRIAGVVHAAGVLHDGLLINGKAAQGIDKMWKTKVVGCKNLLAHLPTSVKIFVSFSSIVATLGNIGQCGYALVNRSMEATLSTTLLNPSLRKLSIRWPGVRNCGMGKLFCEPNYDVLTISRSFVSSLMRDIFCGKTYSGVDARSTILTVLPPGLAENIEIGFIKDLFQLNLHEQLSSPPPPLIAATPQSEETKFNRDFIETTVLKMAKCLVVVGSDGSKLLREPLLSLGMDSMSAAEFAIDLGVTFGIDLPATLVYSYPSVVSIVDHLAELLCPLQNLETPNLATSLPLTRMCPLLPKMKLSSTSAARVEDSTKFDDVCIVGISIDFPQNCTSLKDLNTILQDKQSSASLFPWDGKELLKSFNLSDHAKLSQKVGMGHILSDRQYAFDGKKFRISSSEGEAMHPSQKLLLNNCLRALEDCGYSGKDLCTNTGVFVGIGGQAETYNVLQASSTPKRNFSMALVDRLGLPIEQSTSISAWSATAATTSVAAGRISFVFGFQGPCMAIDTACSSSLVALHAARRSLQLGECEMALVCGVNVIDAFTSVSCAVAGMNSTDGTCHTFDASAHGYGRSEGCGVLVLKRKRDVQRDSDHFYATVKGSAVMQDGTSASLTAPNGLAQEAVIKAAIADARLSCDDISLIEAHGTGTPFGDPVETAALASVFSGGLPLPVTAVKANIGHLEPVAGIAGICSAILSLDSLSSAPNAKLRVLNPLVAKSIKETRLVIQPESHPLHHSLNSSSLFAGVSSFGYSGTISHIVLERAENSVSRVKSLLQPSSLPVNKVVHDATEIFETAVAFREIPEIPKVTVVPNMVWQFSGQGNLKVGAGRELFHSNERFRYHLSLCDGIIHRYLGVTVSQVLFPDENNSAALATAELLIQQAKYSQVILVALEIALAKTVLEEGVEPIAVMGHSLGEYAAAVICGLLSLDESLTLVCERGKIVEETIKCQGVMVAIRSNEQDVLKGLEKCSLSTKSTTSIAAINGKASVVLSGSDHGVAELCKVMNITTTIKLGVKHAFHSPLMKYVEPNFLQALTKVTFKRPTMKFFSTVKGREVSFEELKESQYWIDHMIGAVRYLSAVEVAWESGIRISVEMGPQSTLSKLTQVIWKPKGEPFEALACIDG